MRVLQADVDAARDDPDVDVRRHRPAVAARHRARLDGLEACRRRCRSRCRRGPSRGSAGRATCPAGGRPDGRTCPRRWPARSRSARRAAACRCRRRRGLRCGCARPASAASTSTLPKLFSKMSKPACLRRQADVDVRAGRSATRSRASSVRHCCGSSSAPARGSRTASRAAAQHDVEAVGAAVELRRRRRCPAARSGRGSAPRSATLPRIGQLAISGSPSKYICVISRCTQPSPEIA